MPFPNYQHKLASIQAVKNAIAEEKLGCETYVTYSNGKLIPCCAVGHIVVACGGSLTDPRFPFLTDLTYNEIRAIETVTERETIGARAQHRPINPEAILPAIRAIPVGSPA